MDCIARQKHKSTLEGSCSGIIDYDVELHLQWKGQYVHFLCEKNVFKNNVAVAG